MSGAGAGAGAGAGSEANSSAPLSLLDEAQEAPYFIAKLALESYRERLIQVFNFIDDAARRVGRSMSSANGVKRPSPPSGKTELRPRLTRFPFSSPASPIHRAYLPHPVQRPPRPEGV